MSTPKIGISVILPTKRASWTSHLSALATITKSKGARGHPGSGSWGWAGAETVGVGSQIRSLGQLWTGGCALGPRQPNNLPLTLIVTVTSTHTDRRPARLPNSGPASASRLPRLPAQRRPHLPPSPPLSTLNPLILSLGPRIETPAVAFLIASLHQV